MLFVLKIVIITSSASPNSKGWQMFPTKIPKHAVLIRWGAFQLNIIGRTAIIGWTTLALALLGAKHYFGI